jgi:hypothetical protein
VDALTHPRWPLLAAALAVLVTVLLVRWTRRDRSGGGLPVAHTDRLRALPRYRRLARTQLAVSLLCATGAVVLVAGSVLLAGRPQEERIEAPERGGRDVVLCLEASPSTNRWNAPIVDAFRVLVDDLSGERVGLVIFSGAAVTVVPLTDDYAFLRRELRRAEDAFANRTADFFTGAATSDDRAGQVGDGLVSCVQALGPGDGVRGRAVVLVSDNDPVGRPEFTLQQAAGQAVRASTVVYGIGTPHAAATSHRLRSFATAAETTGGTFLTVGRDGNEVATVVRGVHQRERARMATRPTAVEIDAPLGPLLLATAGFALMLTGALLRRPR